MENENIRQSWEWETDFEQSFLLDEEEGLTKLLVNRKETAREPKRFATLSNEEMVKILEENTRWKQNKQQTGQWQHLKVGLSHIEYLKHTQTVQTTKCKQKTQPDLFSVVLCLILCYKINGSWFGVLRRVMDALGKLGEH